jgi:hypothetical protein
MVPLPRASGEEPLPELRRIGGGADASTTDTRRARFIDMSGVFREILRI